MEKAFETGLLVAMVFCSFCFATCMHAGAVRDTEPYIVVELKELTITDDMDLGPALGELEVATLVITESGKTQTTAWPRKEQDRSWQEMDAEPAQGTVDYVSLNQTIFALEESKIEGEIAIVVMALDNDEKPEWVQKLIDALLQVGDGLTKVLKDPVFSGVMKAAKIADKVLDTILGLLPDAEPLGVYAEIVTPLQWDIGYRLYEDQRAQEVGAFYVDYEVKRIQVPIRTPGIAVRLVEVRGTDWGDGSGTTGWNFIQTRVYDKLSTPGALVQMDDFGPHSGEPGEDWVINSVIFVTDAVGPFLYVEVSVWDEETGNDRIVGLYSNTFYSVENWGANRGETPLGWVYGTSHSQRFNATIGNAKDWGDIEIEFEIIALPFSDVEVTVLSDTATVIPGATTIYAVEIENFGAIPENFTLTVEGLDPDWYSWPGSPNITLDAGETLITALHVSPPRNWSAIRGEHEFTVTATSTTNPETLFSTGASDPILMPIEPASDSDTTAVNVLSFQDVEIILPSDTATIKAGFETIYTIGVRNLGNIPTSYRLAVDPLDFEETWATLWPETLWNVDPGATANGFVEITVPNDWQDEATYNFFITATALPEDGVQQTVAGSLSTVAQDPGESGIRMKLTEGLDYLFREDVNIRIAAVVMDVLTHQTISDAEIHIDIYRPDRTLWIASESMTEIDGTGIYEWQSNATILDLMKQAGAGPQLIKGVYIVHAITLWNGHVAQDIVELHIDPPAAEYGFPMQYLVAAIISLAVVATIFLTAKKRQTAQRPQKQ